MTVRAPFAVVVIGRNEGERLAACLQSLAGVASPVVYVDSGSTDGSVELARRSGATVEILDMAAPFTAARARNAGRSALRAVAPEAGYAQFLDGDCTLAPGWLDAALNEMGRRPELAVVIGRLRERQPERSVFNRLCDLEWNAPPGDCDACGGNAFVRLRAFDEAGGFNPALIAGEEPELCVRLRERGWRISRVDAEMGTHDAAIVRLGQWWRRSVRAGHAFAEVSTLHQGSAQRIWAKEAARALVWTLIPAIAVFGAFIHPAFLLLALVWPAQFARLWVRNRHLGRDAPVHAALTLVGKVAETVGIMRYHFSRTRRARASLIEYKR